MSLSGIVEEPTERMEHNAVLNVNKGADSKPISKLRMGSHSLCYRPPDTSERAQP